MKDITSAYRNNSFILSAKKHKSGKADNKSFTKIYWGLIYESENKIYTDVSLKRDSFCTFGSMF